MSLGETVLAIEDLPVAAVDLPLWGAKGTFFIKSMTGEERDDYDLECYQRSTGYDDPVLATKGVKALLVALTLVDAQGERVFMTDQAPALATKSARMLNIAADVAMHHNGLTKADIEDLSGNSESGPSDSSG